MLHEYWTCHKCTLNKCHKKLSTFSLQANPTEESSENHDEKKNIRNAGRTSVLKFYR